MKIYYIANIRIPTEKAHGAQIMKMCESFVGANAYLELVVPKRKNHITANAFDYYKTKHNFSLRKIRIFDPRFLLKFQGNLYIKMELLFFNVSLFFYLLFNRTDKQDIFYTRDEYLLPLLQIFNKRSVWEAHSLPQNIKYYIRFFKKCHKIIVLTEKIKRDLVDLGIGSDDILVAPDAVDLDIFDVEISREEARKKMSLPIDKIILGYTGTFNTKGMGKGLGGILKSLTHITQDVLFVAIGGSQEDIKYYQTRAVEMNVVNKVLFLEKISQQDLAVYQKAFDILLMPYPNKKHYAYYMSPLKMFEYMASQRPIISSDLPSIREILNENNAIFCQPDNPQDLAEKIIYIISNVEIGKQISQQAYQNVKNHTWQKRAKNIINSFNFNID